MSTPINDGGPAFPTHIPEGQIMADGQPENPAYTKPGMTLRDYFAGEAMPIAAELCHKAFRAGQVLDYGFDSIARGAYELADAMIAARERKP